MLEQLLRMSLNAGIVIIVVLLIRALMMKLPKRYSYMLWAAAGFRLLCPISIESRLSILNAKPAAKATEGVERSRIYTHYIHRSSAAERLQGRGYVPDVHAASADAAVTNATEVTSVAKTSVIDVHTVILAIWVAVAVLIIGYAVYHLIRLKIRMRDADMVEKGIYESHLVTSPFAMGLFRPGIYLPVDLPEYEREYLIEHERTHIRRGDLIFKMIAVVALALHWFNPLAWVAFVLFCRDMEMSCDEIVLEKLGAGIRKNYSLSLVTLAQKNRDYSYVVMPTAFSRSSVGKTEVRMRINNIMNFKKRSKAVAIMASLVVCCVLVTCVLNACSVSDDDDVTPATLGSTTGSSTEESSEETSEETTAESEYDPYAPPVFVSTHGELEDQLEYMVPVSDYPDSEELLREVTDVSVIEDEDVRELAQYYLDQGYQVFDQENQLSRHEAVGDLEYMFRYGFYAIYRGDELVDDIWYSDNVDLYVYKMNEELFEHFMVENISLFTSYHGNFGASFDKPRDTVEDDGTIIRYTDSYSGSVAEYNRETGFGMLYCEERQLSEAGRFQEIDSDALRDLAHQYEDQGYDILYFDPDQTYYYDLFFETEYPYGNAIQVYGTSDSDPITGDYFGSVENVTVMDADEELFETLAASGYWGEEISREDDGNVITLEMADEFEYDDEDDQYDCSGTYTCTLTFDRDTGLMTIADETFEFDN